MPVVSLDAAYAAELLRQQDALQAEGRQVMDELDLVALLQSAGRPEQVVAVLVAVQGHLVPGGDHLAGDLGEAPGLAAEQEERRRPAQLPQRREHRRGAQRVGSVVVICPRIR